MREADGNHGERETCNKGLQPDSNRGRCVYMACARTTRMFFFGHFKIIYVFVVLSVISQLLVILLSLFGCFFVIFNLLTELYVFLTSHLVTYSITDLRLKIDTFSVSKRSILLFLFICFLGTKEYSFNEIAVPLLL